jgi:hypothetical protein
MPKWVGNDEQEVTTVRGRSGRVRSGQQTVGWHLKRSAPAVGLGSDRWGGSQRKNPGQMRRNRRGTDRRTVGQVGSSFSPFPLRVFRWSPPSLLQVLKQRLRIYWLMLELDIFFIILLVKFCFMSSSC